MWGQVQDHSPIWRLGGLLARRLTPPLPGRRNALEDRLVDLVAHLIRRTHHPADCPSPVDRRDIDEDRDRGNQEREGLAIGESGALRLASLT